MVRKLALAVAVALLAVGLPSVAASPAVADKPRGSGGGQVGKPPPGQLPKHKDEGTTPGCYATLGEVSADLLVATNALGTFANTTTYEPGTNCTVPKSEPIYLRYTIVQAAASSYPTWEQIQVACNGVVTPSIYWHIVFAAAAADFWANVPIGWAYCVHSSDS